MRDFAVLTAADQLLVVQEKLQRLEALIWSCTVDLQVRGQLGGDIEATQLLVAQRTGLEAQANILADLVDMVGALPGDAPAVHINDEASVS